MTVTLFTKENCQPCRLTKLRLTRRGVVFEEVSAAAHAEHLRGLGFSSLPVVEVDCGDGATVHWSGYSPDRIDQLAECL